MRAQASASSPIRRTAENGMLTLLPAQAYEARYTPGAAVIGFAFDGQTGAHAFGSDRPQPFRTRPNSAAFTPAGCDVFSYSTSGGEYLVLTLDSQPDQPREPQFTDRITPDAIAAAHRLRRMMLSTALFDRLQLDAAAHQLAEAVLAQPVQEPNCARSITSRRLARLDALIVAHLAEDLSVARLAAALDLSPRYFTRALKAAIGATPHAYVLSRRLAQARRMLRDPQNGLAGIAAACGFASQAHMTTQMRKRLGATPGQLRG